MYQALNQLGSHKVPNPEPDYTDYSTSYIMWARQTVPGNTSATTATASPAVALITLHNLDSCAILVVKDSKGYREDRMEVRLKVS